MTGIDYPNLLGRVVNTPVFCLPDKVQSHLSMLNGRMGLKGEFVRADVGAIESLDSLPMAGAFNDKAPRKIYREQDGVAMIPVVGSLVHRLGAIDPYSGMTGYDGIRAKLDAALSDPDIKGIVLDISSPGGEVAGCFDLADFIYKSRDQKPIWGVCDEHAYSAAYLLASQCSRVVVPETGGAGSIGVVLVHMDHSEQMSQAGLRATLIHAGAHKVDGNPYAPLPDAVRERWTDELESLRGGFATRVARGRGLDVADVLATEAQCYLAQDAVSLGLVDAIGWPADAFKEFVASLGGGAKNAAFAAQSLSKQETQDMSDKDAVTEAANMAAMQDQARKEGAEAERKRCLDILQSDEAKGRMDTATSVIASGMDVDAAKEILATVPVQDAQNSAAVAFANAMKSEGDLDIDADGGDVAASGAVSLDSGAINAAYNRGAA